MLPATPPFSDAPPHEPYLFACGPGVYEPTAAGAGIPCALAVIGLCGAALTAGFGPGIGVVPLPAGMAGLMP